MIIIQIRKTKPEEIEFLLNIYAKARKFMTQTDNASQWQNGYPTREVSDFKDVVPKVSKKLPM